MRKKKLTNRIEKKNPRITIYTYTILLYTFLAMFRIKRNIFSIFFHICIYCIENKKV